MKELLVCGSIIFNTRHDRGWYTHMAIVDSAKGWASTFFYCKDVPLPTKPVGLPAFEDIAGVPKPSWKDKPVKVLPADLAAIQKSIAQLTSGFPPFTGEDTIICWMMKRI